MPGGDGTGPLGEGPMTGRASGYCAGYATPFTGRRWFGMGRGMGYGRGRRLGRRAFYPAVAPYEADPYQQSMNPQDEAGLLKEQIVYLEQQINAAKERITQLENEEKKKK
ncbi:MAG: DUF5320 domain-containing protein [Spirochaetes bacterium]|nr:DUF5320 domain-containing protein [Spirochaetota bacterium]